VTNQLAFLCVLLSACGAPVATLHDGTGGGGGTVATGGGSAGADAGSGGGGGGSVSPQSGCEGQGAGCYTVYAHSNHTLYRINLATKALEVVGAFHAPNVGTSEDVMTDLAVSPDNTIWVVSHTTLYQADPLDGHVTRVSDLGDCGQDNVALSFMPDGTLYVADFKGAFCRIDYAVSPPTVTSLGSLGGNYAVSGDLVTVSDGTMFASAYLLSDASGTGTQNDNVIVKINPLTREVTRVGATGFPRLYGVSYALGKIFAFTHDGTGRVVTIDPATGVGTLFNTFTDPVTNTKISFAGAGVNALVHAVIN